MSTYCHCDWLLLRHVLLVTMVKLTVKILKATGNKDFDGIITPFLKANDKELHFKKKLNVFFKRFKLSVEKITWHLFSLRLSELLSPHPPYLSLSREKLTTCRVSQSPPASNWSEIRRGLQVVCSGAYQSVHTAEPRKSP